MSKIIYVCKTEEEFKDLCFAFDYTADVHLNRSEPICLRVENDKAICHDGLSWYKSRSSEEYKDYKFIECFEESYDDVKNPLHYRLEDLELEGKDIIKSVLGKDGYKNWCHGTALKYLFRAGKKEDELKDFKKAKEYISWIIEEIEETEE